MLIKVIIDAFRAFATASYVLERNPEKYILTTRCDVLSRLESEMKNTLTIGKPEKGSVRGYDIPNSPTRTLALDVAGSNILHRTEAGAKGVLGARDADLILATGFVNADATVRAVKDFPNATVSIIPMGHEATSPSLEDDLCAEYIDALLEGKRLSLEKYMSVLKEGPGRYFFGDDQWQYPEEDFKACLEIGRFDFAIRAVVMEDHAMLERWKV